MMKEILLINPRKRKARRKTTRKAVARRKPVRRRRVAKKRVTARKRLTTAPRRNPRRATTMARKKTRKRRAAPRRNPRRRTARRAISRVKSSFAGLNIKQALKNQIAIQLGMFGSKFFAKLFGPEATEEDPSTWDWTSFAKMGAGAVATAFVAQTIKPGMGQKVLEGGFSAVIYKLIQNKLINGSEFGEKHFGIEQSDDDPYIPDEYADLNGYGGYQDGYEPGDVEQDAAGNAYLLGDHGQWQQLPESSGAMLGEGALRSLTSLGAIEHLSPPGSLGEFDPVADALLDS